MPDLLVNGLIATMDPKAPAPEALLTAGDRVAFVGRRADAQSLAATLDDVQVVDLQGACVIPGLIDMHAHLDREGLKRLHPAMTGLRTRHDVLARISDLSRAAAPGEWIVTSPLGEPPFYFFDDPETEADLYPTRWELDEAAPDNPVYIKPILGFWRWAPWPERLISVANSAAMLAADLHDGTPQPSPSVTLERDLKGRLSGRFFEATTASILELRHFAKAVRYAGVDRVGALRVSQQVALAAAVTTVFEGHGVEPAVLDAYRALHRERQLTVRAELAFSPDWLHATAQPDAVVDRDLAWLGGEGRGDDMLCVRGLFVNPYATLDDRVRGSCGYSGMAGYHYGSGLSPDDVLRVLKAAARNSIRAVGLTPALFEHFDHVGREQDIRSLHWLIQHCGHLPRGHADIAARHNLGLSFLPVEASYKQAVKIRHDKERAADFMPLRRLLDSGQPISIASDNIPPSLFFAIWCCLARRDYRGQTLPDPDGQISREEALLIATLGAARCLGRQDTLGSLSPGKYADLAILDRDYFRCPLDEIPQIKASATMVGGVWRHGNPMTLSSSRTDRIAAASC